ncbi:MAG TPA: DNA-processing protein DprA [Bryobacteraceae bacterium]|jgi:DNA processing protein|nr:DNA-processing protein DprA [Bryobacteraceae bacterium]
MQPAVPAPLVATPDPVTAQEALHWLALRMTPGLGTRKAGQLLEVFRTPQAIFRASRSELQAAGLSAGVAQSLSSGCAFDDAADQQSQAARAGAVLIPLTDARYPPALRDIFDPPPLLFARGRVELLATLMLGVVGTRRPTAYGGVAASKLSADLAAAGMTIASGMARGIDTAAHRGVLEAGGNTVAVFGCGIDQIYPAENRKLAEEIATRGLLISEFPMGAPAYPQNFPIRNRMISGMSAGVLVVEGSEYSGSAITAKLAIEQNREVFAVPGNITSKMSWGPNLLIKQGAKLVQEWNDVMVELKPEDRRRLLDQCRKQLNLNVDNSEETNVPIPASVMGSAARDILQRLRPDAPTGLDNLIESLDGTSSSEAIAALFELELAGLVRQLPGKSYIRVWMD